MGRDRELKAIDISIDLLIAASALEHNLTLVTLNFDDYGDISNLKLYESGKGSD